MSDLKKFKKKRELLLTQLKTQAALVDHQRRRELGPSVQPEENKMIWCESNTLFRLSNRHDVCPGNWCLGSFPQCNNCDCTGECVFFILDIWVIALLIISLADGLHNYCFLVIVFLPFPRFIFIYLNFARPEWQRQSTCLCFLCLCLSVFEET